MWYDCYDTDDGDHYGWISEYYLAFYRDDALSSITGNVFSYYDDRDGFTTNFMLCQDGMLYGESSKYERNPEDKSTHIYYSGFNGYLTDAVKKDDLTLTASVDTMTVNNDRAPYIRKDMVITEKKDVIESGDELIQKLQGVWVMEDGRYFIEFFPKDDIYFFFGMCFAFGKVIDYENFYGDPVVSIYVYDPETDEHAIEGEIHIAVTDSYFYDMGASVREYYIEENGEYIRIADSDFSESVILYPGDSSVVDKWFEEMGYEKWY